MDFVTSAGAYEILVGATAVAVSAPFAIAAVHAGRALPAHMDRQWRRDCSEFIQSPPFAAPVKSRVEVPIVALCALVTAVGSLYAFGFGVAGYAAWLLCWCLLALSVIDLRSTLLPDVITLPLLWAGLLFSVAAHGGFGELFGFVDPGWAIKPESAVIGAAVGYGSLFIICRLFKIATGKDGMGGGDLKLVAALGAWLGWTALPAIALVASCSGLLLAIGQRLRNSSNTAEIPFGPHLALAAVLVLFFWRV